MRNDARSTPRPSRRDLVLGSAATLSFWGLAGRPASATSRDPRLLFVILRGGLDGLSLAAPVGDPSYQALRSTLALRRGGEAPAAAPDLDSIFVLNPAMPNLAAMYKAREAAIIHAVHTPYRERSHFDGQDLLESGHAAMAPFTSGWLNRALAALPAAGRIEAGAPAATGGGLTGDARGLAMGPVVPLIMRGPAPVLGWIPKLHPAALTADTAARLLRLYGQTDADLSQALATGLEAERIAGSAPRPATDAHTAFTEPAAVAASYLGHPGGPRIGALAYDGWDTHAAMGPLNGALARMLTGLDKALATLKSGLGPAWRDTVVIVASEFGRTVEANGSLGTDHGMATTALLAGGAVSGGRVIADWPGLAPKALYEGRDLMPTTDLRAVLKGVLRDHLGFPAGLLAEHVFPDSRTVAPMEGLLG